jgi:hypothetical protein
VALKPKSCAQVVAEPAAVKEPRNAAGGSSAAVNKVLADAAKAALGEEPAAVKQPRSTKGEATAKTKKRPTPADARPGSPAACTAPQTAAPKAPAAKAPAAPLPPLSAKSSALAASSAIATSSSSFSFASSSPSLASSSSCSGFSSVVLAHGESDAALLAFLTRPLPKPRSAAGGAAELSVERDASVLAALLAAKGVKGNQPATIADWMVRNVLEELAAVGLLRGQGAEVLAPLKSCYPNFQGFAAWTVESVRAFTRQHRADIAKCSPTQPQALAVAGLLATASGGGRSRKGRGAAAVASSSGAAAAAVDPLVGRKLFVAFWRSPDTSSPAGGGLPRGVRYEASGQVGEEPLLVPCEITAAAEGGKGAKGCSFYAVKLKGLGGGGDSLSRLVLLDDERPGLVCLYQKRGGPGSLPVALSADAQAFAWEDDGVRWARAAELLATRGYL